MSAKKNKQTQETLLSNAKSVNDAVGKLQSKLPRDLTQKNGAALVASYQKSIDNVNALDEQRAQAVRTKKAAGAAVRTFITRVRSSTRGAFGADSEEYASVGGTRTSDRKRPKRKPKAAPSK